VGCHLYWWHKEPVEAAEWLRTAFPEYYDESIRVKQAIVKNFDLESVEEKYKCYII
jgi:hypothetical protein